MRHAWKLSAQADGVKRLFGRLASSRLGRSISTLTGSLSTPLVAVLFAALVSGAYMLGRYDERGVLVRVLAQVKKADYDKATEESPCARNARLAREAKAAAAAKQRAIAKAAAALKPEPDPVSALGAIAKEGNN